MKESTLKFRAPIERYTWSLPKLASYVFMYSLVMNWETRAVFPTPESPRSTTRYLDTSSISSLSVLSAPTPCPLQQEPSNGDLSPETLLFLEKQERSVFVEILIHQQDLIRDTCQEEEKRVENRLNVKAISTGWITRIKKRKMKRSGGMESAISSI